MYAQRRSGRIPDDKKHHLLAQGSHTFVAHKTSNVACHDVGSRAARQARRKAPRLEEPGMPLWEAAGMVLSFKHADGNTFLAPAVAAYIIKR